jgi:hypothetical protein
MTGRSTEPDHPLEPALRFWLDCEAAATAGLPDHQQPAGGLRIVHSARPEPRSDALPEYVDGPVASFARRSDGRYAIRTGTHHSGSWLQHAPAVWSENYGAWIVEPEHARAVLNLVESLNRSAVAS